MQDLDSKLEFPSTLDSNFFAIFSKGGIVLWYLQNSTIDLKKSINSLIKDVIIQQKQGSTYQINSTTLIYKLDNYYDLVFVAAYQEILKLSYVDKFLTDIQLEFRDRYKNDLIDTRYTNMNFTSFQDYFKNLLNKFIKEGRTRKIVQMKTFDESAKSKKNVSSLIFGSKVSFKENGYTVPNILKIPKKVPRKFVKKAKTVK
ncbi:hypothetical protein A3Q56_05235, partial [Intoshia linei]